MRNWRFRANVTVAGGADAHENWILYQKVGWELWGDGFTESAPSSFKGAELSDIEVDNLVFRVRHIQRVHRGSAVADVVLWHLKKGNVRWIRVLP